MGARGIATALGVLALLTGIFSPVASGADGPAPRAVPAAPEPLLWQQGVPDPAVAATPWGYVAAGTGSLAPLFSSWDGRTWRPHGPGLSRPPTWAGDESIWAPEIVRFGKGRWVMYYSARVPGLGEGARCIGAAVASSPTGPYHPIDRRPLVCPRKAGTPEAWDVVRRGPKMPKSGVIDPAIFRDRGKVYLLYKTQGFPSSIRMVRLRKGGVKVARKQRSRMIRKHHGTIENPAMLRRGKRFFLFVSVGNFAKCGYHTMWMRSAKKWKWRSKKKRLLLNRRKTGICGPGGATVVDERKTNRRTIWFHGWTCGRTPYPCRKKFHDIDPYGGWGTRALYGARLRFTGDRPRIKRWLTPP